MTTSGTYNFNPSIGEGTIYAYMLCGKMPTELTQEHFESARIAVNMMLGSWAAKGVNLWAVELVGPVPLVQGTATYAVDPSTIMVLDAYITTGSGTSGINRVITPISRTEYASVPNPTQQGFPSSFWFDRLLSPTISLWQVPDGNQTSLSYYRVRQIQDANFTNGQTAEIPYYFLESLTLGLAARLAMIWAPERAAQLDAAAERAFNTAAAQNVEMTNFYISPGLSSYYRT